MPANPAPTIMTSSSSVPLLSVCFGLVVLILAFLKRSRATLPAVSVTWTEPSAAQQRTTDASARILYQIVRLIVAQADGSDSVCRADQLGGALSNDYTSRH